MLYAHLLKHVRDNMQRLDWALDHPNSMMLSYICYVLLTVFLFIIMPKGFFPQQDTGRITAIQADQNISFQAMKKKLTEFINIIQQDPAVQNVVGFIGVAGDNTQIRVIFITLKHLKNENFSRSSN